LYLLTRIYLHSSYSDKLTTTTMPEGETVNKICFTYCISPYKSLVCEWILYTPNLHSISIVTEPCNFQITCYNRNENKIRSQNGSVLTDYCICNMAKTILFLAPGITNLKIYHFVLLHIYTYIKCYFMTT